VSVWLALVVLLGAAALAWPTHPFIAVPPVTPNDTAAHPRIRRHTRARGRHSPDAWVADFAEVVAVGLRAGLDLPTAAVIAARSPTVHGDAPWLRRRLESAIAAGLGVATCLEEPAPAVPESGERRSRRRIDHPLGRVGVGLQCHAGWWPPRSATSSAGAGDLALLASAWRLAESTGAAASTVTTAAARSVRARQAGREQAAVVLAGPRTSMAVLSLLPLSGPLVGAVLGLAPSELYATAAARLCALAGVALTGVGWLWARHLLRRAARPARTDGTVR
jgi:tight adherence protein B